ncbi:MAG: hypothetical protein GY828_07515 [Candidatus Gracilibacteria bacterium]|nr:hypothetical protein [Candidatus Gracilibacteria bacterium]
MIKKRIMTTMTIGVLFLSAYYYLSDTAVSQLSEPKTVVEETNPRMETKTKKESNKEDESHIITKETIKEPKKEEETQSEVKKVSYTDNLSDERIANASYYIRSDGYIPHYLEPIDDENPYLPAFYGDIANEFGVSFADESMTLNQMQASLENWLGYSVISVQSIGLGSVWIKLEMDLTPKEVENVRSIFTALENSNKIDYYYFNTDVLPEYQTEKYIDMITEMSLD